MPDLMPCPFCGSEELKVWPADGCCYVSCDGCGVFGPDGADRAHAVAHWNSFPRDTGEPWREGPPPSDGWWQVAWVTTTGAHSPQVAVARRYGSGITHVFAEDGTQIGYCRRGEFPTHHRPLRLSAPPEVNCA